MDASDADNSIIGLEFLVDDLDDAATVFIDALGWTPVERGRPAGVAGRKVVLVSPADVGPAITLFEADETGPGAVLADRRPRLTQVVFASGDREATARRLERLGLPTESETRASFVDPTAMEGVWGAAAAMVVTDLPPTPGATA